MTDKFWIGGTGTWNNTVDTKWSLTSGGPNNTTHPVAGDRVFIDGNSGAGTITRATAVVTCASLDCTGYTGTLATGTVGTTFDTGDVTIVSGMTLTASTGVLTFTGTGTQNITSAGKTMPPLTLNGAGGTVKLLDDLTTTAAGVVTHTQGTLDLNNKTLTCGGYSSSNANTRTLAFGTGTMSFPATGTCTFTMATATNATVTFSTGAKINCAQNQTILAGGALALPRVEQTAVGTIQLVFNVAGSLASLYVQTDGSNYFLTLNANLTVLGDCRVVATLNGVPPSVGGNLNSNSAGTARTLTVNGYPYFSGLFVSDSTAAGSTRFIARHPQGGTTDLGGNTNWIFDSPEIGGVPLMPLMGVGL